MPKLKLFPFNGKTKTCRDGHGEDEEEEGIGGEESTPL